MRNVDISDPQMRTIPGILRQQAQSIGDQDWIRFEDEVLTFARVDSLSDEYANGFRRHGIGAGDLVAVFMENCVDYVPVCMALARLGAVHLPVNTAYKGAYLLHVLGHSGACAVVVDDSLSERVDALAADLPELRSVFVRSTGHDVVAGGAEQPHIGLEQLSGDVSTMDVAIDPMSPMSILYTSGTTGRAKGAVMSHHYWTMAVRAICDARDVRPGDVFFSPSPLFHAGVWLYNIYSSLLTGLSVGVDRRFSASGFWDRVRHYGATQLQSTGAMHMFVWNQPARADDADNPARVWVPVPLPPDLCEPLRRRFGIEHLVFQYGQTELVPVSVGAVGSTTMPGSAGRVVDHYQVQIQDEDGRPVAAGGVGEICVRPTGPGLMFDGYHRDPDVTARSWRGLWHHTGDLGRFEGDELFYVDRLDDYLRSRGENISSFEVEHVVELHPEVHQAAAHAVPSDDTEDELKICVVRIGGSQLTAEDLWGHCERELPDFAVPRHIEFLDELPMTPTGRTQKHVLRERGITAGTTTRASRR